MKAFKFLIISIFLLVSFNSFGQKTEGIPSEKIENKQKYDELSLIEWKKFKRFETKLNLGENSSFTKSSQLRSYAKDSIQILGVKLMAIKLLDEKKLLDRDIRENQQYYVAVLDKLKASAISPSEYLFLEEKMAFINQSALEEKLSRSQWLNVGLLIACVALIFGFFFLKKRRPLENPLLSRQEVTVRNLILEGKTNKEIANELYISLSTVKTHITHIYNKLNVANRQELFQKSTGTST